MVVCYWNSAMNMALLLQIHYSNRRTDLRQPGDTAVKTLASLGLHPGMLDRYRRCTRHHSNASTDCYSDHRFFHSKNYLHLQTPSKEVWLPDQETSHPQSSNFWSKKHISSQTKHKISQHDIPKCWPSRPVGTAKDYSLGNHHRSSWLPEKKHQDWFDDSNVEIKDIHEEKCSCYKHLLEKADHTLSRAAHRTHTAFLKLCFISSKMTGEQH